MARIVPSLMGTSYCLPVRLSVMVRVSAMSLIVDVVVGRRDWVAGRAVPSIDPPRQIFIPAPLAAERPPALVHGTRAAHDAQPRLVHPIHSNQFVICDS